MTLPPWPPQVTQQARDALLTQATNYALANGILFAGAEQPEPLAHGYHVPFALFPSPFPRRLFNQAKELQSLYHELYARVASDYAFLDQVVNEIGDADPFVKRLWGIFQQCHEEGIAQPIHMGIVRSDYLLHEVEDKPFAMRQVEFNAIGCAFGPHSQSIGNLHKYLHTLTGYCDSSPLLKQDSMPENYTIPKMAEGIAEAHSLYGSTDAWVLFLVSEKESNIFDQRRLEYQLVETHKVRVIRQSYEDLIENATLDESRQLLVRSPLRSQPIPISVVYFRAGWSPASFPTDAHFDIRHTIERSRAIKCPTLPVQISGSKKVQQVLAASGVLERFLTSPKYGPPLAQAQISTVQDTFAGMWALDEILSERGLDAVKSLGASKAIVLKPQREGGGNNVYGEDIPSFLDGLPVDERKAWIAMEMIKIPRGVRNWLVRSGFDGAGKSVAGLVRAVNEEVVSELGIFGTMLFRESEGHTKMLRNEEAGYLLRTKEVVNNEGGVGVGFSVLDSALLVEE
ncbi:glutathione synthase [Auriculariales sp. MPI-PUGE-AT-0066]|nr:glutathione synthase [Auriculariales sp. MPI-PUGE-AT-0066]